MSSPEEPEGEPREGGPPDSASPEGASPDSDGRPSPPVLPPPRSKAKPPKPKAPSVDSSKPKSGPAESGSDDKGDAYAREKAKARAVGINTEFIDGLADSLLDDSDAPKPLVPSSVKPTVPKPPAFNLPVRDQVEAKPVSEDAKTVAMTPEEAGLDDDDDGAQVGVIPATAGEFGVDDAVDADAASAPPSDDSTARDDDSDDDKAGAAVGATSSVGQSSTRGLLASVHPGVLLGAGVVLVALLILLVLPDDGDPSELKGDSAGAKIAQARVDERGPGDSAAHAEGGGGADGAASPGGGGGGGENGGEDGAAGEDGGEDGAADEGDSNAESAGDGDPAADSAEGDPADSAEGDPEADSAGAEGDDGSAGSADEGGEDPIEIDEDGDVAGQGGGGGGPRGGQDPKAVAEAGMTAEELAEQAKLALKQKRYRDAYRLASRSYTKDKKESVLAIKVHAACGMKNKDAAKRAIKELPLGNKRRELRSTCRDLGVRVGL